MSGIQYYMKIKEIKEKRRNNQPVNTTASNVTARSKQSQALTPRKSKGQNASKSAPPACFMANVNPFSQSAFGAKYPDDCTYPSIPYQTRASGLISGDTTFSLNAQAYRYHPVKHRVGGYPDSTSAWTYGSARSNAANVDSLSTLTNSFGLTRTIGFGIRISAQQSYTTIKGFCHVCVVPETLIGSEWNYPTTISAMTSYKSYSKYSMADILQSPIIVSSQFYGPNAKEYRDPSVPDCDTSQVTYTRTSTGWGVIIVAFTGISSTAGEELSVEYIAHLECLPKVLQGAGQLPIQSTPSPNQPLLMAALTTTVPHTPTSFHEIEAKGNAVLGALSTAWNLGVNIARTVAPIAEGVLDVLSLVFA
jgi:hypothetical protein